MRIAILVAIMLALSACSNRLRIDRSGDPVDIRGCAARGGHVEGRGMFGINTCVTPYADAGRTCTDSSQCAGRCLLDYDSDEADLQSHPIGRQSAGRCEADNRTFGCHAEIVEGRVTQAYCVD